MITYDIPDDFSPLIIKDGSSYTFSDYFRLGFTPKAVAQFHGYELERSYMQLPQAELNRSASIEHIRQRIIEGMPHVNVIHEMARREFMIAPIVFEVVIVTKAEVTSEMPLTVSDSLRGTLDYYLEGKNNHSVIVEAKRDDMDNGFAQLTAELIALDQWLDNEQPQILGAVSVGKSWAFGVLDRKTKVVHEDLRLYRVPDEVEQIVGIMAMASS